MRSVRCPGCSSLDDKVVDSRLADEGTAIRRRRECLSCNRRFTTYERLEEAPLTVTKRSGDRLPFDRAKVVAGVAAAAKNRPVSEAQMWKLAGDVEEEMRLLGADVSSADVGLAVLRQLESLDQVAYVRFASVYKGFENLTDFQREMATLAKSTAPKRH